MSVLNALSPTGERYLMARTKLRFEQFGIEGDPDAVIDTLVDMFNDYSKGSITIDELCLHPREALAFCDSVRRSRGWIDLPDHMILRPIMTRRKSSD